MGNPPFPHAHTIHRKTLKYNNNNNNNHYSLSQMVNFPTTCIVLVLIKRPLGNRSSDVGSLAHRLRPSDVIQLRHHHDVMHCTPHRYHIFLRKGVVSPKNRCRRPVKLGRARFEPSGHMVESSVQFQRKWLGFFSSSIRGRNDMVL